MTNCFTKYYLCDVCKQPVEYSYPTIDIVDIDDDTGEPHIWTIDKQRQYYKAKARYEHNQKHKGLMDTLLEESRYGDNR